MKYALTVFSLLFALGSLISGFAPAFADDSIHLKAGDRPFGAFIEEMSDGLGITINASDMSPKTIVNVAQGGNLTRTEAFARLHALLWTQGYALIHTPDLDIYRIKKARDARDGNIPLFTDLGKLPDNDQLVTFAFYLRHIEPDAIARLIRSFAPAPSRIVPYSAGQLVLITDTARAMKKYQAIITRMDTPQAGVEAKEYLKSIKKEDCAEALAPPLNAGMGPHPVIPIALFSLMGLILGFLVRGYVIRRIEGGL